MKRKIIFLAALFILIIAVMIGSTIQLPPDILSPGNFSFGGGSAANLLGVGR